jgi:hypothetical protein
MNIWFPLILIAGSGALGFVFGWLGRFSIRSRDTDLHAPAKDRREQRERDLLLPLIRPADRPEDQR